MRSRPMKGQWLRFSRTMSDMGSMCRGIIQAGFFWNGSPRDFRRCQCIWGTFKMPKCPLFLASSAYPGPICHLYEAFYCLPMLWGSHNKYSVRLRCHSCWAPPSICLLTLLILERLEVTFMDTAVGAILQGNCLACDLPPLRTSSVSYSGGFGSHVCTSSSLPHSPGWIDLSDMTDPSWANCTLSHEDLKLALGDSIHYLLTGSLNHPTGFPGRLLYGHLTCDTVHHVADLGMGQICFHSQLTGSGSMSPLESRGACQGPVHEEKAKILLGKHLGFTPVHRQKGNWAPKVLHLSTKSNNFCLEKNLKQVDQIPILFIKHLCKYPWNI